MAIKEYYQLKKYWVADPCLPQNSPWDGLTCDNSSTPDLSNSRLDGIISGHISKLTALTTLNLSRNNLNGQVPAFLQDLPSLIKIDLSNNNLSGPLPASLKEKMKDGQLMFSIENNPRICQEGQCSQDGKTTHKSRRTVIVISLVISTLLTVLIVVAVIVTIKRRKQDNHQQYQTTMEYKKSGIFTYSEVVAMTNDFDKVIGKGGSGTVYYGHLKDGREVAVKKVAGLVEEGTKEFQVEVHLLMQVHHKHLAPFIGYCDDGKQMVLIYEYMANGNLRQRLSDERADALNWQQRLRIAFGAATGLEYLHSGCTPAIIHRDVKSSNILLNANFEAKIADFGLSKSVISSSVTHITTAVAGTAGYLDPEYWCTGKVTEKSDVYGFGVVLLWRRKCPNS
ncbi:probable LRR receptor-like serine/threonine-protein kinase At4g29180 [Nymphaea colorata]|nr:probable LRR receptor-like serine/threonine-protein kinase At4g29180 [Nymphaea colorata]